MQIIDKVQQKIKNLVHHEWFDGLLWFCVLVTVGLAMFSLGVLYERQLYKQQNPVTVTYNQEAIDLWNTYQRLKYENVNYFGSKSGSIVYPVDCSKGDRIKEENKIFFTHLEQALNQGYREVTGC